MMYLLLHLFGSILWGLQVEEFPGVYISLPLWVILLLVGVAVGAVVVSAYLAYLIRSTRFKLNPYIAAKIDVQYRQCFRDFYNALGRATTDADTKDAFENFTGCLRTRAHERSQ